VFFSLFFPSSPPLFPLFYLLHGTRREPLGLDSAGPGRSSFFPLLLSIQRRGGGWCTDGRSSPFPSSLFPPRTCEPRLEIEIVAIRGAVQGSSLLSSPPPPLSSLFYTAPRINRHERKRREEGRDPFFSFPFPPSNVMAAMFLLFPSATKPRRSPRTCAGRRLYIPFPSSFFPLSAGRTG